MDADQRDNTADFVRQHESWNFLMCWGNGALVSMGGAFFAVETVMAGLVYQLTQSSLAVGIITSMSGVGWLWPQIFVGNWTEHRPRKMPAYTFTVYLRGTALFIMPLTLLVPTGNGWYTYFLLLAVFAVYVSGCGVCVLPFWDVLAKVVPRKRVPMLLAYRNAAGGMLGFVAGLIVSYVLAPRSGIGYPYNYIILFGIGGFLSTVAYGLFVLVREPVDDYEAKRVTLRQFLKRGPMLYRQDKHFRRYFYYRCYWALCVMSQALFVPYAMGVLGAPAKVTGWFAGLAMMVTALASFAWGRYAERFGVVALLRISACALGASSLVSFALATAIDLNIANDFLRANYLWFFVIMFATGTAGVQGLNIAGSVYILQLARPQYRATYQAFMNALNVPLLCTPILAGLLVQNLSYEVVFGLSTIAAVLAVHMCNRLVDREEGNYPDVTFE